MSQKALCIMAAGLGTRFGGLKQLHPIINGFSIVDFSIYDAYRAGFNEIILIIRRETLEQFQTHFSKIDSSLLKITYVFQTLDIPQNLANDFQRQKPWGTGHALLTLKPEVFENFALINADDFYGRQAFLQMHDNLYNNRLNHNFLIGYHINKTLSPNGAVSRGECVIDDKNHLKSIVERHNIRILNNKIVCGDDLPMSKNTIVSMNFWGFSKAIFDVGESAFQKFINNLNDINSDEFYITSIVDEAINNNQIFKVLTSNTQWYGITYKPDDQAITRHLGKLIDSNYYPKNLCNKTS